MENVIFCEKENGVGGMPVGVNGRAMRFLLRRMTANASYIIASAIEAVHFHSFPFTSEKSKEKIELLATHLSRYTEKIKIHMINLLPIQKRNCTKMSRRIYDNLVTKIYDADCVKNLLLDNNCGCLATGESIGQLHHRLWKDCRRQIPLCVKYLFFVR